MRRLATVLLVLVAGLLVATAAAPPARASGALWGPLKSPRWSLTPGLSTGVLAAPDLVAGSVTAELTGAWKLLWLTVGLRTAFRPDSSYFLPFAEVGVYFLLNLGVGYSAGFTHTARDDAGLPRLPRHNVHLFVGIPIPLRTRGEPKKQRHRILFLEPYYRPAWGSGGGAQGWSHEVGLLLKLLFGWGRVSILG